MGNSFKEYIGIVVEDRKLESRQIKVFLREMTPFAAGKLGDNTRNETFNIKSDSGATESGSVSTTNNVTADYFGGDSNRAFPPDVVKGEQVKVCKYADEDKYYWTSMGRDDNRRKTELIRWAASNNPGGGKDLTEDNTYFLELDTKLAKRIRLHTSKTNGETFGYDIMIDASNGFIKIGDDVGNGIEINSQETVVKVTNKNGALFSLDKNNVIILAPETILMRAGQDITLVAPTITNQGAVVNTNGVSTTGESKSTGNMTAPLFVGNLQGSDGD